MHTYGMAQVLLLVVYCMSALPLKLFSPLKIDHDSRTN